MFGRGDRGGAGSLYYDEPGDRRLPFDKDPIIAPRLYLRWWILGAKSKWLLAMALLLWIGATIAMGFAVGG